MLGKTEQGILIPIIAVKSRFNEVHYTEYYLERPVSVLFSSELTYFTESYEITSYKLQVPIFPQRVKPSSVFLTYPDEIRRLRGTHAGS